MKYAFVLLVYLTMLFSVAQATEKVLEIPSLSEKVDAGALPDMAARLPVEPRRMLMSGDRTLGQYGGRLRLLMAKPKDIRMMTVYGYARLVAYNLQYQLVPDILQAVEVSEGRRFTLRLREGHKWSDGAAFTSEDFRYYWEQVANNPTLSASGPPKELLVEGKPPAVQFPDASTVIYEWHAPNPRFLPALARPRPLYIYRPAHYLKQFHENFQDEKTLKLAVKKERVRNWASLHFRHDKAYKMTDPDRPSLQPWTNTQAPPAERFVFVRNPYFHRVDAMGRQLPYIDEVVINISSKDLIPAKVSTGEADLQARYLDLSHYTFLKEHEPKSNYRVLNWRGARGSELALYPNLNAKDLVWRTLNQDVRYRRALSMAINRYEINQVIYFGLADQAGNSVIQACPLYEEAAADMWASHNPLEANRMLDALGLEQRNDEGIRLLSDGRPMELIVHTSGDQANGVDTLELIRDHFATVGIKLFIRTSQRDVLKKRVISGEAVLSAGWGLDNALATAEMAPSELAPIYQIQYQWPSWGAHFESGQGEAPSLPAAQQLLDLYARWNRSETTEARKAIWQKMLMLYADHVFSIGTISGVMQPVVVNKRLRNVPDKAWYSWEPGAFFGIYQPDTFFFDTAEGQ